MNNLTQEMLNHLAIEGLAGKNFLDKYKIWSQANSPDTVLPFLPSTPGWYYCKGKESKPNGLAQGKEYIVEVYLTEHSVPRFRTWNYDAPVDYTVEWLGPVKPFSIERVTENVTKVASEVLPLESKTTNPQIGDLYKDSNIGITFVVLAAHNNEVIICWENGEAEYLDFKDLNSSHFKYMGNVASSENPTNFKLQVGSLLRRGKTIYLLKSKVSQDIYNTIWTEILNEGDLYFDETPTHISSEHQILGYFPLEMSGD